jgi:hypothetical protein
MTENQQKLYDGMREKFDPDLMKNPAFAKAVEVYAKMCDEEKALQEFVDENGISYETENRDGQRLWKHYPQHQALTRLRTQMTAVLRTLLKYTYKEEVKEDGEELFA